jgi:hypothetical protein
MRDNAKRYIKVEQRVAATVTHGKGCVMVNLHAKAGEFTLLFKDITELLNFQVMLMEEAAQVWPGHPAVQYYQSDSDVPPPDLQ